MSDSGGLFSRATGDLLVLLIAGTICFVVIASGASIFFLRLFRPELEVSNAANLLSDTVNTLIGLLAGFLAGRSDQIRMAKLDEVSRPNSS